MPEQVGLLANLLLAVAAGLLGAVVAVRLRQSVILGYLAAGIAIGPFTPGITGSVDTVHQMAEIGLVLLMFSVGLSISFRHLLSSGIPVLLGSNVQIVLTFALGYLAGIGLGWGVLQALFLGAIVSISSTAVLTKTLGERGELNSTHGQLALAWAAMQDLVTVLLVVLLAALSSATDNLLLDAVVAIAKAGLFLVVVGPLGYLLLPWAFDRVAALRSRELFVLMIATVAMGVAYASTFFGISLALGAFIAGVAVAESDLSHQILGEITPITDVFAALFFVSMGMLVNPAAAASEPEVVLAAVGLIVLVKGVVSAVIPLAFGYSSRVSLLTGLTMAQSGEFSFVLASLGSDLGVLSRQSYSLMLVGVAASMALSPILLQMSSPIASRLAMRPPRSHRREPSVPNGERRTRRGHAVICGYGRVGRIVAGALGQRGFPFIVIDEDHRLVRRLKERQVEAAVGNAANPVLLEWAGVRQARIVVIALPEVVTARQIVDYSRRVNPALDIVVRTHSWAEREWFLKRGVGEVVMSELELALEMTRHTLRRLGVSALEAQALVQGLRQRVERGPLSDVLDDTMTGG